MTFPNGCSEGRLTHSVVENIMRREWGDLFEHVVSYGNIDFSRRWLFYFNSEKSNDMAVSKEIFINFVIFLSFELSK